MDDFEHKTVQRLRGRKVPEDPRMGDEGTVLPAGSLPWAAGSRLTECWVEAEVKGWPVHFYRGATLWRVCVLDVRDGKTCGSLFVTPHVFETDEKAHEWLVRWLEGDRQWDRSWGRQPDWPKPTLQAEIRALLKKRGWHIDRTARESHGGELREFIHPETGMARAWIDALCDEGDREYEASKKKGG